MKSPAVCKVDVSEEEFMEYYYKYRTVVYSILWEYKLDPVVAEDIALHVFCKLPSLYKKYDINKGSFVTYICLYTKSVIYHAFLRKDKYEDKRIILKDIDELVDENTKDSFSTFKIKFLKDYLNEEEYTLIYSIYVLGMTLKEYAINNKIGYSTVRKKHNLLIDKIRKKMIDYLL